MTYIYDVCLEQLKYRPVIGYYGEPKYIIVFYDYDISVALKEMQRYVKKKGFVTPDGQHTVANVVLRQRTLTGQVISITPYCKLFDNITDKLLIDKNKFTEVTE